MSVPTSIESLSVTPASNSTAGTDQLSTSDDNLRTAFAFVRQLVTAGSDIASSSTITPPSTGSSFAITGTTGITAIASTNSWDGRLIVLRFAGALVLSHSANLVLPGAANITTAAGDYGAFRQVSSGVWHLTFYQRNAGLTNAADITTGTLPVARLNGSTSANFVRGDGSYSNTLAGSLVVQGSLDISNTGNNVLLGGGATVYGATAGDIFIRAGSTGSLRLGSNDINSVVVIGSDGNVSTSGAISLTSAASRIIPGATSFAVRNNANSADNLLVTDAGSVTALLNPAFGATASASRTTLGTFTTYTQYYDTRAEFDPTAGTYTASTTGLHHFSFMVECFISSGTGAVEARLYINGASAFTRSYVYIAMQGAGFVVGTYSAYHNLTAGDVVRVELTAISGTGASATINMFSGRLCQ